MRKALNENTTVQIVVLALLVVAGGLLFMSQMGGSKGSGVSPAPAAATPGTTASPSATTSPGSTAAAAPSTTPVQSVGAAPLSAGPGLPRTVLAAYEGDKTIVLLVARSGGIDDRLVRDAVGSLKRDPNLAVFVTRAKGIARYSRITEGVGVSQVPALVVVSPKSVGGGTPKATVSYGFRDGASVAQAVRDAVYKGRTLGYDPG